MSPTVTKIDEEIEKLDSEEMIELNERLISRIHEREEEEGLSPEWETEIERRVGEIRSGKVKGRDAFEVLDEVRAKYSP